MLKLNHLLTTEELAIYTVETWSGAPVGHMFVCRICGILRVVEMHDEARGRCTCSCVDNRLLIELHSQLQPPKGQG